jgi:hypothetical protein
LFPTGPVAVWVITTAVKNAAFLRLSFNQFSAVFGAFDANRLDERSGIAAVRKVRTGDKFAEPTIFDDQVMATQFTLLTNRLGHFHRRHLFFCLLDSLLKRRIKFL